MIGDDETLLARVARYLKRLTTPKPDPTLMTKEEFFARVDAARERMVRGEGYAMLPGESWADFRKRIGR